MYLLNVLFLNKKLSLYVKDKQSPDRCIFMLFSEKLSMRHYTTDMYVNAYFVCHTILIHLCCPIKHQFCDSPLHFSLWGNDIC